MTAFLPVAVIALAWVSSALAAPKTGLEYEGLVGPVHEVIVSEATLEEKMGQVVEGPPGVTEITTYNKSGDAIEHLRFSGDDVPFERQVTSYDAARLVIENLTFGRDGAVLGREILKSEDGGERYTAREYDANGTLKEKAIMNFDRDGNLLESKYFDPDGRMLSKMAFTYNSEGRVEHTKHSFFKRGAEATWVGEYSYDSKGNARQRREHYPEGGIMLEQYYDGYLFDAYGNWIRQKIMTVHYDDDGDTTSKKDYVIYREITYYKQ